MAGALIISQRLYLCFWNIFPFLALTFSALGTDSRQISEIVVIIFSDYLFLAWQNVKSNEFQFGIVLH